MVSPGSVPAVGEDNVPEEQMKEAPIYPMVLVVVNLGNGFVLKIDVSREEDYIPELTEILYELIIKHGKPSCFVVCNDRAKAFISKAAEQIDADLIFESLIPELDEVEENFIEQMTKTDLQGEDIFSQQMLDDMAQFLSIPENVWDMPDQILEEFAKIMKVYKLPPKMEELLRKEIQRRHL